jgi:hypothetical protein
VNKAFSDAAVFGRCHHAECERWLVNQKRRRKEVLLMSSEENKQIALSLLEALNARDLSLWSRHLAEDYIAEHPGVSAPPGQTQEYGIPAALRDGPSRGRGT